MSVWSIGFLHDSVMAQGVCVTPANFASIGQRRIQVAKALSLRTIGVSLSTRPDPPSRRTLKQLDDTKTA